MPSGDFEIQKWRKKPGLSAFAFASLRRWFFAVAAFSDRPVAQEDFLSFAAARKLTPSAD